MNKIKVNMAVEPNDIQTLHCSQYDTEERKFTVDLHENGVGVSPSSISNQLVYKSFKGGTEQILPVNTSTPSTSPIIADIQYKDGLREDEEFLYRESPSSVDGYAKIKEIRGNTLVWNQLCQNGNFADTSNWSTYLASNFSVSNNVATVTGSNGASAIYKSNVPTYKANHKFLGSFDIKTSITTNVSLELCGSRGDPKQIQANTWGKYSAIVEPTSQGNSSVIFGNCTANIKNVMFIDLTQMFGSGNEPTIAEFKASFPLSYYAYDSGSLLSFGENKLKFNQLVQNGNFEGTTHWSPNNVSLSANNNILSVQCTTVGSANYSNLVQYDGYDFVANHKYLFIFDIKPAHKKSVHIYLLKSGNTGSNLEVNTGVQGNMWNKVALTADVGSTPPYWTFQITFEMMSSTGYSVGDIDLLKNVMLIDLTAMYGSGKEPLVNEYLSMFNEEYYPYNTGTIVDNNMFMRTVGENLVNPFNAHLEKVFVNGAEDDGTIHFNGSGTVAWSSTYLACFYCEYGKTYTVKIDNMPYGRIGLSNSPTKYPDGAFGSIIYSTGGVALSAMINYNVKSSSYAIAYNGIVYLWFCSDQNNAGHQAFDAKLSVNYGNDAIAYEPYTEKVLPMPITQYFPTGLKSAGSIYDQLDETGYITRVGEVDLGSLEWRYYSGSGIMESNVLADAKLQTTNDAIGNAISPLYQVVSRNTLWARTTDKMIEINPSSVGEAGKIWVYDTSYTDATTFKNAMSGVYLYYELETPTEVPIITASIVTNYGEMPLYNDNGELKADCIADVSQNSGFQIAKVKLKDENGEIYSNPFQIHTERSPI